MNAPAADGQKIFSRTIGIFVLVPLAAGMTFSCPEIAAFFTAVGESQRVHEFYGAALSLRSHPPTIGQLIVNMAGAGLKMPHHMSRAIYLPPAVMLSALMFWVNLSRIFSGLHSYA